MREVVLRRQKEDLWRAVLEAAEAMGLPDVLPRLVASKLPVDWWPQIPVKPKAGGVDLEVPHRCPLQGSHEPRECLTAILVELAVHRRQVAANGKDCLLVSNLRIDEGRARLKLRTSLLGWARLHMAGFPGGSLEIPALVEPAVNWIREEYPVRQSSIEAGAHPAPTRLRVLRKEM